MAKKSKKKGKSSPSKQSSSSASQWLLVDPARVRFQHSRIRPYFSGCGRSVQDTLESIRRKELAPSDLPPIQVIVGPEDDDDGPWYFSLNNRRLWVFKKCREEGLLENNLIRVRVRQPKSGGEEERYTLKNCAVEAKFIREKDPKRSESESASADPEKDATRIQQTNLSSKGGNGSSSTSVDAANKMEDKEIDARGSQYGYDEEPASDSDSSSDVGATTNRFSALM